LRGNDSKGKKSLEEPNDRRTPHGEVIFHILFKCEKLVLKKFLNEKSQLSEMPIFLELHWSFNAAGSAKFEKNWCVLSSRRSCNKR